MQLSGDVARPAPREPRVTPDFSIWTTVRTLVADAHQTIIDKLVDRLVDVDSRADHVRFLQGDTRFQNRLALGGPDLVVGELGALLELLVHHRIIELGH